MSQLDNSEQTIEVPGGLRIVLNPGSGALAGASREAAEANMRAFLGDLDLGPDAPAYERVPPDDERVRWRVENARDDGRYGFLVRLGTRVCGVAMPGWPLERVRYLGPPQDPWDFPRLYVDGNSWLWCFALDIVRRGLAATDGGDGGGDAPGLDIRAERKDSADMQALLADVHEMHSHAAFMQRQSRKAMAQHRRAAPGWMVVYVAEAERSWGWFMERASDLIARLERLQSADRDGTR